MLAVHPEVNTSIVAVVVFSVVLMLLARLFSKGWSKPFMISLNVAVVGCAYMLYFFRDPERLTPDNPNVVYAGADGKVMGIKAVFEDKHLHTNAVRISIFLSLTDVHINRAPISGSITFAQYFPGARYFTFLEKSSDFNQHSEILIENDRTKCLVNQVVGPIARRVVFWVKPGKRAQAGQRIGMMKFGSRLDIYLPENDVQKILVKTGQTVKGGETPLASLKAAASAGSSNLGELTVEAAREAQEPPAPLTPAPEKAAP